jgi:hypothetical protein
LPQAQVADYAGSKLEQQSLAHTTRCKASAASDRYYNNGLSNKVLKTM